MIWGIFSLAYLPSVYFIREVSVQIFCPFKNLIGCFLIDKGGKNIQWIKDNLFNKWCWEIWSTTCKRMKLEPLSNTIHKNKFKMDYYWVLRVLCIFWITVFYQLFFLNKARFISSQSLHETLVSSQIGLLQTLSLSLWLVFSLSSHCISLLCLLGLF